jgi:EF hand
MTSALLSQQKEHDMTRMLTSVAAAAIFGALTASSVMAQTKSPSAATKLSDSQCTTLWDRIDTAKSGSITQAQAQSYVTDFKAVDTNNDGKLSKAEFTAGCGKGVVHDRT